jgi:hypothetical protein
MAPDPDADPVVEGGGHAIGPEIRACAADHQSRLPITRHVGAAEGLRNLARMQREIIVKPGTGEAAPVRVGIRAGLRPSWGRGLRNERQQECGDERETSHAILH